ncbi:MAG: hypothetical protein U0941_23355 [Planctomycetaceae bacterium]
MNTTDYWRYINDEPRSICDIIAHHDHSLSAKVFIYDANCQMRYEREFLYAGCAWSLLDVTVVKMLCTDNGWKQHRVGVFIIDRTNDWYAERDVFEPVASNCMETPLIAYLENGATQWIAGGFGAVRQMFDALQLSVEELREKLRFE